jgi:DNA-binding CsgD family transcriptional regulator
MEQDTRLKSGPTSQCDGEMRPESERSTFWDSVPRHEPSEFRSEQPFHLLMAGFEALELLNIGLLLTTASGQLLMANRVAQQILADRDGLELTEQGHLLVLTDSGSGQPEFLGQIVSGPGAEKFETRESVVAVQRPSGKRPLTLLIRSADGLSRHPQSGDPLVSLFVLDAERPLQSAEAELRQFYGFTAAEARLANLLMEGRTLKDCCAELGVRRPTVCSQLQRLFRKTGVQRQSELVSVLFRSIGLIRAGACTAELFMAASVTFQDAWTRILEPQVHRA